MKTFIKFGDMIRLPFFRKREIEMSEADAHALAIALKDVRKGDVISAKYKDKLELFIQIRECECPTCVRYHISDCTRNLGCNECNPKGIGINN